MEGWFYSIQDVPQMLENLYKQYWFFDLEVDESLMIWLMEDAACDGRDVAWCVHPFHTMNNSFKFYYLVYKI